MSDEIMDLPYNYTATSRPSRSPAGKSGNYNNPSPWSLDERREAPHGKVARRVVGLMMEGDEVIGELAEMGPTRPMRPGPRNPKND
jgi:hypothetical protein